MYNAAPLRCPCLHDAYLVLYEFISFFFPFIFMLVSLLPGAINQGSCCAVHSDSSASLRYLFTWWCGSHTSVCWEGILISCNFPAPTCTRVAGGHRCGFYRVTNEKWVWNWHPSLLHFTLHISHQVSSPCHIWRTCCTHWRIRVQKHYLFFILGLELESKSMIWGLPLSRAMTERWK